MFVLRGCEEQGVKLHHIIQRQEQTDKAKKVQKQKDTRKQESSGGGGQVQSALADK